MVRLFKVLAIISRRKNSLSFEAKNESIHFLIPSTQVKRSSSSQTGQGLDDKMGELKPSGRCFPSWFFRFCNTMENHKLMSGGIFWTFFVDYGSHGLLEPSQTITVIVWLGSSSLQNKTPFWSHTIQWITLVQLMAVHVSLEESVRY